jgi:hypothetical protein
MDPEGQKSLSPEPMEIDALPPPIGFGASSAQSTTSVRYSTMPRQDIRKCINCFMQSSLHQGSCATTSRISVVMSYPVRAMLHNPNATRNIAKWAAGLAEFELDFL